MREPLAKSEHPRVIAFVVSWLVAVGQTRGRGRSKEEGVKSFTSDTACAWGQKRKTVHPLYSKGGTRLEKNCPGNPRPQDEGGKKWPLTRSCLAPRSQPTQILFLPAGQMLRIRLRPLQSLSGCAGGLCSSWIPAPGRVVPAPCSTDSQ